MTHMQAKLRALQSVHWGTVGWRKGSSNEEGKDRMKINLSINQSRFFL